ncbi:ribonuclease P protein component [Phenylobacterium sp.]|uniref:ribonuclease P protein component n=1 Tax=Phenylobacterium sp. TaxID=1871053 RepID=UPI002DF4FB6D|nr:ribonuclease P protein component [Phenylobacterium sp.]
MADAVFTIERLKKRADFLACARAPSCARGAIVVQARIRPENGEGADRLVRAGFTATKRVGGAVVRNRAKRRMREAARLLLPALARPGVDYVFIARGGVTTRPWERLLDDVKSALIRLAADRDSSAPDLSRSARPSAPSSKDD